MKLLTLLILFCTLQSSGQSGSLTLKIDTINLMRVSNMPFKFNTSPVEVAAYLKNGSDTLEIFPGKQIKFIKIGDRVYKIESPRLVEVTLPITTIVSTGAITITTHEAKRKQP